MRTDHQTDMTPIDGSDHPPCRSVPVDAPVTGRIALPLLLLLLLLLLRPATGGQLPNAEGKDSGGRFTLPEFREALQTMLADTHLRHSFIGLKIVRLDDTSTIAEVNPGKLFHPGSNMKLLTSAAALALLPSDFTFRTRVFCDAAIEAGQLRGNLYLTGGGDPLLDTSDVDSLAGIVAASGIAGIVGDIVADLSLFDTLFWGKGWMWDDEPDPDAPFITPLAFNHAVVSVIVSPGPRAGAPAHCVIAPSPEAFILDNTAVTVARTVPDSLIVTRARGEDRIIVRGTMSASAPADTTMLSVRSPTTHFLHALKERLAVRGITVGGALRTGRATGRVFLGQILRPLAPVLRRTNAMSDNFAAESLLKVIAADLHGGPGSAHDGLEAVGTYLAGTGRAPHSMNRADGSGVSWYNAIAPDDVIAVLRDQYSRQSTFGAYYGSLALAGFDGTLESRMRGTAASGRVRGKTGTLTGVSSLSGYATTLANERIAFCIMINHFPGSVRLLRSWQDALLAGLVRLAPAR